MEEKVFYRMKLQEFLGDQEICTRIGPLHYGIPDQKKSKIYDKYEDFVQAVKNKKIFSSRFYFKNRGQSQKLFTTIWGDYQEFKSKYFTSYSQTLEAEILSPSYDDLLKGMPVNELLDWFEDKGLLPNIAFSKKEASDPDAELLAAYKAGKTPNQVKNNISSFDGKVKVTYDNF